ncbi:NAD(P)-dependent oxidoreductase [Granulicella tundricola]|uniref:NAD(P)-binding domain-containing protein n=1 Tax=Granulicella tundricola (strain ATCC BAA-1859 / DSM 23138 / MP5ACTX9) TaxID=1198114 RepID=E8X1U6_GRATM|nr:NAD(P)H-binding protein [Granulicella tundricola]ADW69107.1 hypothetical protein AciX9_2062 [Granulicella tundricola MP5ACTX9]
MKVLVIGAGGKSGRLVVEKALAVGHEVVALVHSAESEEKHPMPAGAEVFHGDVRNPSKLEAAMAGCQGVVDAIGGTKPFLETTMERDAAKVVLEVMGKVGAKRLVVISVMGVGESRESAGWFYDHLLLPVFLRGALPDKTAMEDEVKHSDVDWVLVRPPVLKDSDETGVVRVLGQGELAESITRGDLARFLVEQLTSEEFVGRAVTVAN